MKRLFANMNCTSKHSHLLQQWISQPLNILGRVYLHKATTVMESNSSYMGHYVWLQILKMLSYWFILQISNIQFYLVSTFYNFLRFKHECCFDYLLAQVTFRYYFNNTAQKFQLFFSLLHNNFRDKIIAIDYVPPKFLC